MHSSKKYFIQLLVLIFFPLSALYGFNYLINPLGVQRSVPNSFKPIYNERNDKFDFLFTHKNWKKYDGYFLGGSTIMQLAPSRHPTLKSFYNLGLSNILFDEMIYLIEQLVTRANLKTLIIGIDFASFNKNYDSGRANARTIFTQRRTTSYLSITTLNLSYKTLQNFLKNRVQNSFDEDGAMHYALIDHQIKQNPNYFTDESFLKNADGIFRLHFHPNQTQFVYNYEALEKLRKIKKICDENKVKLSVFIPPENHLYLDQILGTPQLKNAFTQMKTDLYEIFEHYYDFTGINSVTTDNKNFYDLVHFNRDVGDRIIRKLFSL